jgi:hypothetical protein
VCHFIPIGHPYIATTVAHAFFTEIVRLHGLASSIVRDRDTMFTSNFWRELFRLSGVHLNMSTTFHPQTVGQSKAANKVITMYLRYLSRDCLTSGCSSCRGSSFVTTRRSRAHYGPRLSALSTVETRQRYSPTRRARPVFQRLTINSQIMMNS